jgi:hypothetical protein
MKKIILSIVAVLAVLWVALFVSGQQVLVVERRKVGIKSLLISTVLAATLFLFSPIVSLAEPSAERFQAMDILHRSYSRLQPGNNPDGVSEIALLLAKTGIERALALDPDFAYAHIVRAEMAMMEEDWETAEAYYVKGLKLVHGPDQIFSPVSSIEIKAEEVEADARVFLAYTYIQLSRMAYEKEDPQSALVNISMAKINLMLCLDSKPNPETKQMAEELLAMLPEN